MISLSILVFRSAVELSCLLVVAFLAECLPVVWIPEELRVASMRPYVIDHCRLGVPCLPSGTAHKAGAQPGTSSGLYSTWNRSLWTLPTVLPPDACLYAFHNISPRTAPAPDSRDVRKDALVCKAIMITSVSLK